MNLFLCLNFTGGEGWTIGLLVKWRKNHSSAKNINNIKYLGQLDNSLARARAGKKYFQ